MRGRGTGIPHHVGKKLGGKLLPLAARGFEIHGLLGVVAGRQSYIMDTNHCGNMDGHRAKDKANMYTHAWVVVGSLYAI